MSNRSFVADGFAPGSCTGAGGGAVARKTFSATDSASGPFTDGPGGTTARNALSAVIFVSGAALELVVRVANICSANWRAWDGGIGAEAGWASINTGGSLLIGFATEVVERERFTSTVNGFRGGFMAMRL
ncbi:hypothetical protein [Labrys miyagiensis]|uniref:hypothetical protein n=1 Tax=Labrys miyagiensis TaxID=346912 RepID=UPI0024E13A54|nr:hypothetical protein [Labrys miyagiensis]